MLTDRQNLLETLKIGGKPDRIVNQYKPFVPIMNDAVMKYTRSNRARGITSIDRWGTTIAWPQDQIAAMPHVTEENKVIPDITEWRKYVNVPDIKTNSNDWSDSINTIASIDRNEKLAMCFMGTGIFEQAHFLMGFEDTLINFLAEPEYMHELLETIFEYRMTYVKLLVENLHPDIILSHDDWGAKHSMFMSPDIWREFLKPLYAKFYGYMHDNGVMVMHHADSFLEPIVEDMIEIGIDIWQGVLPQNDIPRLQKQIGGRMTLMGGIDAAIVDRADSTEEEIRTEVRRVCETYVPAGNFIPCITYGLAGTIFPENDKIIIDEIDICSKRII